MFDTLFFHYLFDLGHGRAEDVPSSAAVNAANP
jgi:hypothetical protein